MKLITVDFGGRGLPGIARTNPELSDLDAPIPLPEWGTLEEELPVTPEDEGFWARQAEIVGHARLTVFLASDDPVLPTGTEPGSPGAERMRYAALGLRRLGHRVCLFAPAFGEGGRGREGARSCVRPLLLQPEEEWRGNARVPSLEKLSREQFDRMLMGGMALVRLTAARFGTPDVVVTQRLSSFWNAAAAGYPLCALASEKDHLPEGIDPQIRRILQGGARAVGSLLVPTREAAAPLAERFGIDTAQTLRCLHASIPEWLLNDATSMTKMDLLGHFSQELSRVSPDARWIVLAQLSRDPGVEAYLRDVAFRIEQEPGHVCILLTREASEQEAFPLRSIVPRDRHERRWLLSIADAAIVYTGTEGPPSGMEAWERRCEIARMTAVLARDEMRRRRCVFPGGLERDADAARRAYQRIARLAASMAPETRRRIDEAIALLQQYPESDAADGLAPEIVRQAKSALFAATQERARERLVSAAEQKGIPAEQEEVSGEAVGPPPHDDGLLRSLEDVLYDLHRSKGEDAGRRRNPSRSQRAAAAWLDAIVPVLEVEMAWERLAVAMERGQEIAPRFRRWQDEVLRALADSSFRFPADADALPNAAGDPDAMLPTIARLSGLPASELQSKLEQHVLRDALHVAARGRGDRR
jgi:hypothetical protein